MIGRYVRTSTVLVFATLLATSAFAHPFDDAPERATLVTSTATTSFGAPTWLAIAESYKGTNPTRRSRLWCADFLNLVLAQSGAKTSNSSMARSFATYGTRLAGPQVGAIAVLARGKRDGHVGIVKGFDARGNPIIISGNFNRRVGEGVYPRHRVIAYVWPN